MDKIIQIMIVFSQETLKKVDILCIHSTETHAFIHLCFPGVRVQGPVNVERFS